MMQKVCDKCGAKIDEEVEMRRMVESKTVSISGPSWLDEKADYCEKCQNKMLAEVYKMGWDLHKQQRKPKHE